MNPFSTIKNRLYAKLEKKPPVDELEINEGSGAYFPDPVLGSDILQNGINISDLPSEVPFQLFFIPTPEAK